ncbi:MAG: sterol desaturase family protein [Proteobacteria bacterium]|nr:sterol desaturase family protein [Pseudomonadota bacterium]
MVLKSLIVTIGIIFFLLLEFFFPKEKIKFKKKVSRISKNIFFWLMNIGITPIIILPITIYATQFEIHNLFKFDNLILSFLFHLIIIDVFLYWWHRLNHEIPFLWRFHHVHHLDETLDVSSGIRFHFGEVVLSALVRCAVIIAFNISLTNLLLIEAIVFISSAFHHSNIKLPQKLESILSHIIVTPSIHWVHHHKRQKETDSNYCAIFSFWDYLFGTKSKFKRYLGMPIGVEGDKEQSLSKLITRPLK